MKNLQIFGLDLSLRIQMTVLSEAHEPALSFAIDVKFVEHGNTQEGKIVVHNRDVLKVEGLEKRIDIFAATLITEEKNRLCTGFCYHDGPIQEIWLTTIEVEGKKHISSNKECTCPTSCDCQNPPPKGWNGENGTYHISESCPVHNENPRPDENCPIHGTV